MCGNVCLCGDNGFWHWREHQEANTTTSICYTLIDVPPRFGGGGVESVGSDDGD